MGRCDDIDIDAEWRAAQKLADWQSMSWLIKHGVPTRALLFGRGMFRFGIGRVRGSQGTWDWHADGHRSLIVPANETDGAIDDLVAWRPNSPATFWRRGGRATFMGREALYRAAEDRVPLHVFATPFDWLKRERNGLVILDWHGHLPIAVDGVPELLVDDLGLAGRLRRMLERPRAIPPIRVHRKAVARAAVLAPSKEAAAA